jgi:hypothetical protein
MTVVELRKQCSLAAKAGSREPCDRDTCAFWQGPRGCAVERLEIDGGGLELADFLLSLRGRLELNSLFG